MHGWDCDDYPICYIAYRVFKDQEMYDRVFDDSKKQKRFLWWVQETERGVRLLQLKPKSV